MNSGIWEKIREMLGGLRGGADGNALGKNDKARSGEWGEAVAEKLLKEKGYKILGRRVRVGRWDEIDLVARQGEILVFVEVKTREHTGFGRPLSAVDKRKRRALSRAAVRYLKKLGFPKTYFRFDVVEVVGEWEDGEAYEVNHIENAFHLDKFYMLPY